MPRLSQSTAVTTETTVELSTKLAHRLQVELVTYASERAEITALTARCEEHKERIETLFADAGEYDAVVNGCRVDTPMGSVPLKIVVGESSSLDKKMLMRAFKLTPADLESCTTKRPKKPYLSISLPKEQRDGDTE